MKFLLLRRVLIATALLALAVVGFAAYGQPQLLLDFVNLRYCG